jgi:hypothetical protein
VKLSRPFPANKYRNTPIVVDNIRFASLKEATRYGELKLLEKAGEITRLELQPRFPLGVNGKLICTYVGDFYYREVGEPHLNIVEDVKGFKTPEYKLKARLFEAVMGFAIREV